MITGDFNLLSLEVNHVQYIRTVYLNLTGSESYLKLRPCVRTQTVPLALPAGIALSMFRIFPPSLTAGTYAAVPETVVSHTGSAAGGTLLRRPFTERQVLRALYLPSTFAIWTNNHY